ncbi:MAG: hypothetical protein ACK4N6_01335 [Rhodocyclaceae bacterium]
MKQLALTASFLTAAVVAASAFAQMGPGMGPGGKGRFAWNKDYTPGWALMTPQERTDWAIKMREVKTYDECKAIQEEHHKAMEARAAEKGVKLIPPRMNGCDVMKARGLIK